MKRYDFNQVGGFPLEQERLKWLQDGYINAINALAQLGNNGVPRAVFGVELTSGSWTTGGVVSDGYIAHPTLGLMPFIGGAFTPTTRGVSYTDITTPLTFGNASNQNVEINRVAQIAPGALWDLRTLSESRWGVEFGKSHRGAWDNIAPNVNTGSGVLSYKIDRFANTLMINGNINRGNGLPGHVTHFLIPVSNSINGDWNFATSVGRYINYPNVGYPVNAQKGNEIFSGIASVSASSSQVLRLGVTWEPTAAGYTQYFSTILPLD